MAGSNSGTFSRSEDDFSPNAVLTWKPSDDQMVYFSYAEGFKGGGYQLWPVGGGALTAEQIEFEAESALSLELGGKHTLLDRYLQLNWSLFQTEIEDLQVSAFDPQLTAQNIVNAAEVTSRGLEADITWLLGENHKVTAHWRYWMQPTTATKARPVILARRLRVKVVSVVFKTCPVPTCNTRQTLNITWRWMAVTRSAMVTRGDGAQHIPGGMINLSVPKTTRSQMCSLPMEKLMRVSLSKAGTASGAFH